MLERCTNPKHKSYVNYGGRGISVVSRWYHFRNFAEDMGVLPDPRLTIERVDNSKGYEPGNCKWDTRSNQCVNRRKLSSNTSGATGITFREGRFHARFDYGKERFNLGYFDTLEGAQTTRSSFLNMFFKDRDSALASISGERIWCTSSTNLRGVTPHKDGGYIARCTIGGVRHYLGYFQTAQEAFDVRAKFLTR